MSSRLGARATWARRYAPRPVVERMLESLGADAAMVESVLGDLAEERAERVARDGVASARLWYLKEALRSAPWLLASGLRQSGWRGRDLVLASGGTLALLATGAVMLVLSLHGDPARVVGVGDTGGGIVVNNTTPVHLDVHVFDARGHELPDSAVRYRWAGGMPLPVTPRGMLRCAQRGDASVLATIGTVGAELMVRCRPVLAVLTGPNVAVIVGEGAAHLPFVAIDYDGRRETDLHGAITVANRDIAGTVPAVDGQRLVRARSMGTTRMELAIGDHRTDVFVDAYRRAASPTGIRPGEQVAVRVNILPGTLRWWKLSKSHELYRVRMLPDGDEERMPVLSIYGANCASAEPHAFLCAAPRDAFVFAYYPVRDASGGARHGNLAVARDAAN